MKNVSIKVILVLFIGLSAKAQNIGIGTTAPHASAQLDITAANKGLLIPRMALANRPASPATGLLIYQTNSTPGFYYYDGSSWVALKTPAFSLPYIGSTASDNAFEITSTSGEAIVGNSQGPGAFAGGEFTSSSITGTGVIGNAKSATGINYGVSGLTSSPSGYGGYFRNEGGGAGVALATGAGNVDLLTLAGSGNRMVMASSTGRLIAQPVQWITNGNNMYNANSGYVAIGISNPAVNLQVNDPNLDGNILITNGISGTSIFDGLRIRMNSLVASIQNNENSDLIFSTNGGATGAFGSPQIWLKPSGAVGIGTTTPTAKLEILGEGAVQPALNINNGFIKVSGANKTAFTVTGAGANTSGHILTLNYANQLATDILLVTHNYNPGGVGGTYHNVPVGVYWDGNQWTIYSEDTATPMLGKSFNVLVIKQ